MEHTATIRTATPDDIDEILPIWSEFMAFHRQFDPHFPTPEGAEQTFAAFIGENIAAAEWTVLVAEVEGRVVGYHMGTIATYPPVFASTRFGNIFDLAVTRDHRCRGIGTKLSKTLIEWFARNGIQRIEVRYAWKNPVSTAFWLARGFEPFMVTAVTNIT